LTGLSALLAAAWLPALPALLTSSSLATLTTTLLTAALLTIVFFVWHFVTPFVSFSVPPAHGSIKHARGNLEHACDAAAEQPDGCSSRGAAFSTVSASEALQTIQFWRKTCQKD
jgi:hypothetical protein